MKQATDLARLKKKKYVKDKLDSDKSSKTLYSIVNNLLDNNKEISLPLSTSDTKLANEFSKYFRKKVNEIRASIQRRASPESTTPLPSNVTLMYEFEPTTEDELKQIVTKYGVKSAPDDPVPAVLMKENIEIFIPYWVEIVNLSLQVGSMDSLKNAILIPLIKISGSLVDKENFKNYRPVSNLLFLSKLVEREWWIFDSKDT